MNLRRAFRVWLRNASVYRKLYRSSIALNFFEPLLYLLALGIGLGGFVKEIDGLSYLEFIAPGIVMSSAMYAACYECTYGTYVRMEYQKTFDAIMATPIMFEELVLGELLWGATKSLIYGVIILSVISAFGVVKSIYALFLIPYIFCCGLLFASLSIIATAIVPGIDSFNYFYTLFLTPIFLFSGIFFPVTDFKDLLMLLVEINPLFHFVSLSRSFCFGSLNLSVLTHTLFILSYLLVCFPLAFILLRRRYLL